MCVCLCYQNTQEKSTRPTSIMYKNSMHRTLIRHSVLKIREQFADKVAATQRLWVAAREVRAHATALLASGVDAMTGDIDKLGASSAVATGLTGAAAGAVERARARDALPRHMSAAVAASASNAAPPSTGPMMSAESIPLDEPSAASDGGAAGGELSATVGASSTVTPSAVEASSVVPRLEESEVCTWSAVMEAGTAMVAVMRTLAAVTWIVTSDLSTPAAVGDLLLQARLACPSSR